MGQLNIKDEALIADAKALADLLGTSTTDAIRRAVNDRLARERVGRDEER
ncbi:MAG: type II toxin-antitoxin system VapB family antitoxin, partial [Sphingomicrobium sp.]